MKFFYLFSLLFVSCTILTRAQPVSLRTVASAFEILITALQPCRSLTCPQGVSLRTVASAFEILITALRPCRSLTCPQGVSLRTVASAFEILITALQPCHSLTRPQPVSLRTVASAFKILITALQPGFPSCLKKLSAYFIGFPWGGLFLPRSGGDEGRSTLRAHAGEAARRIAPCSRTKFCSQNFLRQKIVSRFAASPLACIKWSAYFIGFPWGAFPAA